MRRIVLFLLLSCIPVLELAPVSAETDFSVSAQVDRSEVEQGGELVFQIDISGPIRQAPKIEMTSLEGFRVVSSGQSQQIQMRGGQVHQTLTFVYTLVASEPGDLTIGPVRMEVQGKKYETQPIQVRVLPGPERPAPRKREPAPQLPKLEGEVTL